MKGINIEDFDPDVWPRESDRDKDREYWNKVLDQLPLNPDSEYSIKYNKARELWKKMIE